MISLDFNKPSILRNMLLTFVGAGFAMGVIFPVFASLFVEFKQGMLLWFIIACILAGLSIGFFNYWLLQKMLLKRLMRIGDVANAISRNDITHTCTLQSDDFIGDMSQSFNRMSENLRKMVNRIAQTTNQLNQASGGMQTISQNTHRNVSQQKSGTQKIADSIQAMNQSAIKMSDNTLAATQAAKQAESATQQGATVVQQTIDSIKRVASEVEKTSHVIQELKADSVSIT